MFYLIGKKIKTIAKVFLGLGIIGSVIGGFGYMIADGGSEGILPGILIVVLGSLYSLVSAYLLFGFGQLIDNSDKSLVLQGGKPYPDMSQTSNYTVPQNNSKNNNDNIDQWLREGLITQDEYDKILNKGSEKND